MLIETVTTPKVECGSPLFFYFILRFETHLRESLFIKVFNLNLVFLRIIF